MVRVVFSYGPTCPRAELSGTLIYVDVVEWSRALDVRLSEWCCSVTMVWVQILSKEEKNLTALKSNSNTVWFNFQTYRHGMCFRASSVFVLSILF